MKRPALQLAAICSLAFTLNASAAVLYVDLNSTNPLPPYAGWSTAATNIQDAIDVASASGLILVTNGIYQTFGRVSPDPASRVVINKVVTVQSVNGPSVTFIKGYQVPGTTNGTGAVRCAYLSNGSTLSGFTLTNGATQNYGSGGGVCCQSTNCLVTNCVIVGNSAYGSGGGAYSGTLVNCVLVGNMASKFDIGNGGGAYNSVLVNCLLTGNQAGYIGGAASWCTLINCTVVSNSAAAYNGSLSACTAINSIVYYNFSYYTNVDINSGSYFTNCCTSFAVTFGGANNFTNPPLFANLSAGDFHLNAASSCISAGNNSFITNSTDLDGNPRIVGGTVDLGAYEFQSPVRFVSVSNTAPVSPFTNWVTAATNIQDAIDAANAGDFIVVSNGVYNYGGRAVYGMATNRVVVDKAVTVQSVNGAASTIIQGVGSSLGIRCAYLTNGAALTGFTLTTGGSRSSGDLLLEESGGGIWCESSSAVVSNCVVGGNVAAQYGGGIYQGTLFNCIVTNNRAQNGGGTFSNTACNCTLIANHAQQYGGAAYQGTLNNCIITNNQAFLSGGGTYLANLNNCVVSSNKLIQGSGGGGASFGILSNCLVTGNFAPGYGGGTYFSTLNNCIVSSNFAQFGGGVCWGVVNDSIISNNLASASGGGAFSNTLNNCVLIGNVAKGNPSYVSGFGGGAYHSSLTSCIVVSNSAPASGGGVFGGTLNNCLVVSNSASYGGAVAADLFAPPTVLNSCTIYDNSASIQGGGLISAAQAGPSHLFATNCIVFGNTAPTGSNYFFAFSEELIFNCCCTAPLPTNGTGNITGDPQLVNPGAGDFHLQTNSPCINSGNNASAPAGTDLDGNPRIAGGTVDIGAYEFQTPSSVLSYAWAQQYGLPTDGTADFADPDHDGMNNWQEWIAGTNPTNAQSVLKMTSARATNNPPGLIVTWQSVSGIIYFLQSGTNLGTQPPFSTIQSNIVGQTGTTSYTDTTATNGGPFFYRVGVQ
jgi:hypothetical protein